MFKNALKLCIVVPVIAMATGFGCAQVAYNTLQQTKAMECQKMQSTGDRDECLKRSNMSYDEYQRQLNRQGRQDTGP